MLSVVLAQIWGIPAPVTPPRSSVMMMEAAFQRAADMHARYWNQSSLLQASNWWLRHADWFNGRGRTRWEVCMEAMRQSWSIVKKKAAEATPQQIAEKKAMVVSPKLAAIIEASIKRSTWTALQQHVTTMSFTLCHNDFHASNMLLLSNTPNTVDGLIRGQCLACSITKSASIAHGLLSYILMIGVRWFDWSEIGPWDGATELAQTMISDMKSEEFTKHARSLVNGYWRRLVEKGVNDYSEEQCWKVFVNGGADRWISFFVILAALPMVLHCCHCLCLHHLMTHFNCDCCISVC
jgi:thiamine kinase-like enzyme